MFSENKDTVKIRGQRTEDTTGFSPTTALNKKRNDSSAMSLASFGQNQVNMGQKI